MTKQITLYPARIEQDEKWKLLILCLYDLLKDGVGKPNPKLVESWPRKGRDWEFCLKAVNQVYRYLPDDVKAWVKPVYDECVPPDDPIADGRAKVIRDHPYYHRYPYLLESECFDIKKLINYREVFNVKI